jgi:hypothetical protein
MPFLPYRKKMDGYPWSICNAQKEEEVQIIGKSSKSNAHSAYED